MRLTICIPIYNFDVCKLVNDLNTEIRNNSLNAEIILIDDASNEVFKQTNDALVSKVQNFIHLEKNIGRSLIRNLFLYYAKGDYLLFLDCDGKIISKNFLKNYFDYLEDNSFVQVLCGGRIVSPTPPESSKYLRWKFAHERENLPVNKRIEIPYLAFQTNNFVVKRSVLEKIKFNPEFQKYGYEDLLFAMDLKHEGIDINHVENPILNNDIEDNSVYLKKVEESVESLVRMLKNKDTHHKISEVKLVKTYHKLYSVLGSIWLQKLLSIQKKGIREKLLKGNISLWYLDFYKLGLLFEQMKKKTL